MGRPLDTVLARPLTDRDEQQMADALARACEGGDIDDEFARLHAQIIGLAAPSDSFLELLAQLLEHAAESVRLALWRELGAASPDRGEVAVHRADALIDANDDAAALAVLLDAAERRPENLELFEQLPGLAERAGGSDELRYHLLALRARIERAESSVDDDRASPRDEAASQRASDEDGADNIRETYSELLEAYCDDPSAVTAIRALGKRIRELEDAGVLPSVLVRRGDWRKR